MNIFLTIIDILMVLMIFTGWIMIIILLSKLKYIRGMITYYHKEIDRELFKIKVYLDDNIETSKFLMNKALKLEEESKGENIVIEKQNDTSQL